MTSPEGLPDGPTDPTQGTPESIGSYQTSPDATGYRQLTAKRLNGAGAALLIIEAIVVLFVPRAIAQTGPGLTSWRLTAVLAVVALLIVVAGLQRRPWGVWAGLVVQIPVLATGLLTGVMWFLGGLFVLLWIYLIRIKSEVLRSLPTRPPAEDG